MHKISSVTRLNIELIPIIMVAFVSTACSDAVTVTVPYSIRANVTKNAVLFTIALTIYRESHAAIML